MGRNKNGPNSSQQQGKKKKTKAERRRLKKEEQKCKSPAKRWDPKSASAQQFNEYMRRKNYFKGEVRVINKTSTVWPFVSAKEDVCPLPVRLASLDYPREWFLDDHFEPLKEFIMNRNSQARQIDGQNGPEVQAVLKVDGYALVLAKDDFTVEFVRGLIPLMADDGMPVKEPTAEEIKEFDSTRGERCDPNILIKYRKHGWKIRQKVAEKRQEQEQQ